MKVGVLFLEVSGARKRNRPRALTSASTRGLMRGAMRGLGGGRVAVAAQFAAQAGEGVEQPPGGAIDLGDGPRVPCVQRPAHATLPDQAGGRLLRGPDGVQGLLGHARPSWCCWAGAAWKNSVVLRSVVATPSACSRNLLAWRQSAPA